MPDEVAGVIPARYASSRFPGKPLAMLGNVPMIVHVCRQAAKTRQLNRIWVATDDDRIAQTVRDAGFEARMTPPDCPSGSDRIMASLWPDEQWEIIVNIQGDEPTIDPDSIDAVVNALHDDPQAKVSTAAVPIFSREVMDAPHVVKVVRDHQGRALYFSRSPLPSPSRRETPAEGEPWGLKHLGLYAYRLPALKAFAALEPGTLERIECLEQLRFLEHGIPIQVAIVDHDSIGVDTPEDLAALSQRFVGNE